MNLTKLDQTPAQTGSMIWGAWMAALPAGLILYAVVADSPFVASMESNRFFFASWVAIQIGALLAGAAIALGGAPVLWSALRDAVSNHRRDILLSFALPVGAVSALIGWIVAIVIWTGGRWAPLPWTVQFSNPGWPAENVRWVAGSITAALMIVAFTGSAIGVARILRRSRLQDIGISLPGARLTVAPMRFAGFLAPFAAAGFAIMFFGALGWGVQASRDAAFHSRLGPLGLTSSSTWLVSVALFAASAGFAVRAARRSVVAQHTA